MAFKNSITIIKVEIIILLICKLLVWKQDRYIVG